jgi:hypothetical protein
MSGDDKRKLGKIQLERKLVARQDGNPPSSATRSRGAAPDAPVSQAQVPPSPPSAPASGVVSVDLETIVIAAEHLVVPRPAAEALVVLPLRVTDDTILVAMADPGDRKAIDEIEFATGKTVSARAVPREALRAIIAAAYDAIERGHTHYRAPRAPAEAQSAKRR